MTIWFTSDNHFGHENIIKFTNRPFNSVEEMDAAMVNHWNAVVEPSDTVYHLGDFCLGDANMARRYFAILNGHVKILGNPWHHDRRWLNWDMYTGPDAEDIVEVLPPMVVLEFPEYGDDRYPQVLVLCHYPLAEWDRKHYGAWHLHGHSHGHSHGKAFDIGVDCNHFRPISLSGVARHMAAYTP
jgi:calcineurin-like phosphoesterase family protein